MRALLPLAVVAAALALTSCATPAADDPAPGVAPGALGPQPPSGEVVAQGTVLDEGGDAELCLGPIAESYPPQCAGIPLEGWSWEGLDGSESSGGTTSGAYAITGTFDGDAFTVTRPPILLALYDPMRPEDPSGGVPGETTEARLAGIQRELPEKLGSGFLSSYPDRGYLWIDVVWDDGTWQDAVDAAYGPKVVFIRSAMRELGP